MSKKFITVDKVVSPRWGDVEIIHIMDELFRVDYISKDELHTVLEAKKY